MQVAGHPTTAETLLTSPVGSRVLCVVGWPTTT